MWVVTTLDCRTNGLLVRDEVKYYIYDTVTLKRDCVTGGMLRSFFLSGMEFFNIKLGVVGLFITELFGCRSVLTLEGFDAVLGYRGSKLYVYIYGFLYVIEVYELRDVGFYIDTDVLGLFNIPVRVDGETFLNHLTFSYVNVGRVLNLDSGYTVIGTPCTKSEATRIIVMGV